MLNASLYNIFSAIVKRKSKSSAAWLDRQTKDQYVKQAHREGWRSRAAVKLQQLDKQNKLLLPGMRVLDIGSAPGGWSQYAVSRIGEKGRIVAVDIEDMLPIKGVDFVQGDISSDTVLDKINMLFSDKSVNLVMSDMAPKVTGMAVIDIPRILALANTALTVAERILDANGTFLVKVFQGSGLDEYQSDIKHRFSSVIVRKPPASRSKSNEIYLLARCLRRA